MLYEVITPDGLLLIGGGLTPAGVEQGGGEARGQAPDGAAGVPAGKGRGGLAQSSLV